MANRHNKKNKSKVFLIYCFTVIPLVLFLAYSFYNDPWDSSDDEDTYIESSDEYEDETVGPLEPPRPHKSTKQGTPIQDDPNFICKVWDRMEYWNIEDSSAISNVGYSEDDLILSIQFLNTETEYFYYDVPDVVAYEFLESESMGGYFNEYIKGEYYCERIEVD